MEHKEILTLLAFYSIHTLTKGQIIKLKKSVGNLSNLFSLNTIKLKELGLSDGSINKLKTLNLMNFEKYINNPVLKIITIFDQDYPEKLKNIMNPPLFLFLKGNTDLLNQKMLSIVGTRTASKEAIDWGKKTAESVVNKGYKIVSGGAIGIDTGAHEGALAGGDETTICVLGGGVNNPYPKENAALFNKIFEQKGLLISETLPDEPVNRFNLLLRNRITSALSDGMLIVASKEKGGAMWQSKVGVLQKKPIFCPSLSLNLKPCEGPKQLLDKKVAISVKEPEEIVEYLNKASMAQKTLV
ncbi:MAG: DNA-protecting protein DprA [Nanoarchaeota archaeon]|nr:DNA-protecting protein DprA [Nanoarchaeota archaeon]